jgi:hypothetical protein
MCHPDQCSTCDTKPEILWRVGQPLDYDSATVYLCIKCIGRLYKKVCVRPPVAKKRGPVKKTVDEIRSFFGVWETIDLGARCSSITRLSEELVVAVRTARRKNMDRNEPMPAPVSIYYSGDHSALISSACKLDESLRNRIVHRPEMLMPTGAIVVGSFSPGVSPDSILIRWGTKK